ncbi:MAG TPA: hypothetical protein VMS56_04840 [Thermoanaerobaculia bacterium]|nr:hypothetical protein [Thermoanaerobaculia bacterium]
MSPFPEAGFLPLPAAEHPDSSRFRLSERSPLFDGHFDGDPILPGIAHMALALSACEATAYRGRALRALRDLRLTRRIGPGDEVEVVVSEGEEPLSILFEIRCGGESASRGLLIFGADEADRR